MTRLCITALTSCTPYDRRSKCLMNITNTVTWWSRNALSKLVKKLEASYNYPGRKYFSLATLGELCTLASNKTVKPVICVQLFFSQTVGTLSNSRWFFFFFFAYFYWIPFLMQLERFVSPPSDYLLQLIQGNIEPLPGHPIDVISPAYLGCMPVPSPGRFLAGIPYPGDDRCLNVEV